jgi:hypothetical protein
MEELKSQHADIIRVRERKQPRIDEFNPNKYSTENFEELLIKFVIKTDQSFDYFPGEF